MRRQVLHDFSMTFPLAHDESVPNAPTIPGCVKAVLCVGAFLVDLAMIKPNYLFRIGLLFATRSMSICAVK